jgi:hypothetical protein
MEDPGEQCTVVFALIVPGPSSECVCTVYGGSGCRCCLPPPPRRFCNNLCKEDSEVFSRFLHASMCTPQLIVGQHNPSAPLSIGKKKIRHAGHCSMCVAPLRFFLVRRLYILVDSLPNTTVVKRTSAVKIYLPNIK